MTSKGSTVTLGYIRDVHHAQLMRSQFWNVKLSYSDRLISNHILLSHGQQAELCRSYMWNKIISKVFCLCWCLSEIILFQCMAACLKLFQKYFTGLQQLMNNFQHACGGWNNFIWVSDVVTCEIKHWNNCKTVSNNFISHLTMAVDQWWLSGRVFRTSDSRVEGSPPGHDTAWLYISETVDHLRQVNCLGNCNYHLDQLTQPWIPLGC